MATETIYEDAEDGLIQGWSDTTVVTNRTETDNRYIAVNSDNVMIFAKNPVY